MKKTYQKPEVDLIRFNLLESMLDEDASVPNIDGDFSDGEW